MLKSFSPILQGYNRNEEYIVTQHPLKSTITDFWRMVWDRNSMTVVLLSQTDTEVGWQTDTDKHVNDK